MKLTQNQNFSFPPSEEFERVVKRAKTSNRRSNFLLPPNATELEKAKYKLCKDILFYKQQNKLSTENIAQRLESSIPKTEYILYSHINKLHLDELINYANKLHLSFELKINANYGQTSPEAH
jgi:predicted XRE-type DNA-binding protein